MENTRRGNSRCNVSVSEHRACVPRKVMTDLIVACLLCWPYVSWPLCVLILLSSRSPPPIQGSALWNNGTKWNRGNQGGDNKQRRHAAQSSRKVCPYDFLERWVRPRFQSPGFQEIWLALGWFIAVDRPSVATFGGTRLTFYLTTRHWSF